MIANLGENGRKGDKRKQNARAAIVEDLDKKICSTVASWMTVWEDVLPRQLPMG